VWDVLSAVPRCESDVRRRRGGVANNHSDVLAFDRMSALLASLDHDTELATRCDAPELQQRTKAGHVPYVLKTSDRLER
jgi:hypothetical protein